MVENIERNKVKYRETINFFTKKRSLTPKPFFKFNGRELILESIAGKVKNSNQEIKKEDVQWTIPYNQRFLYKFVNLIRNNRYFSLLEQKHEKKISLIRSKLIKFFYQPYSDYKDPKSTGFLLMKNIIIRFLKNFNKTPVIIMPIPTYHYYVDGAKPIYQNFFNSFKKEKENIYICDPLTKLDKIDLDLKKSFSLKNDKSHFSKKGHKFLSDYLKDIIVQKKLINIQESFSSNKLVKENKKIYILGISAFYHDSAASIICDGKIIAAAQEERFTRRKNDQSFPINSINYCLEEARINQDNLDAVVFYDNAYLSFERVLWTFAKTAPDSLDSWQKNIPNWIKYKLFIPQLIKKSLNFDGKILHNFHHRSHLSSAFFPSPFKKSTILTIDGVGEWSTASIGLGEDNKIKMLKEISFPNSVGLLYSAFTQFIGFEVNSGEYKMMGLAPYGKPKYYDKILNNLIDLKDDGSIIMNQHYFDYLKGKVMTNKNFANFFGGEPRKPETKITQREMDIACSIQKVIEKIILNMAKYAKKITNCENLCLSGGVALNCVANGYLLKSGMFKKIWVQPASGDAGSSLGCALDAYYTYFKKERKINDNSISNQEASQFGPSWNNQEIKSFLETEKIKFEYYENINERNKYIALRLNKGDAVGFFNGRGEFGPRALGSRSIIGDPRNKDMQTKLNLKIKNRESFRPFAPAILSEKKDLYFELDNESPYMMFVAPIKKEKRLKLDIPKTEDLLKIVKKPKSTVPAVTHIDYSARVQTVDKKVNENFYKVIKEFENLTNCPLVINTSFNIRGEPIVNSPIDAFKCFLNTEMDILVLENYIIKKEFLDLKNFSNWKEEKEILSQSNTIEDIIKDDLKKIYFRLKDLNKDLFTVKNGWNEVLPDNDSDETFSIDEELKIENYNPEIMSKKIIKNWQNKRFGEDNLNIIFELIKLSKKFKFDRFKTEGEISGKIYEMF